jgi:hypothetical protein
LSTELRKLLEKAIGTNESVIAIIVDIRGFTPFCKEEESVNVANFIKRVYIKIIDDFFPRASFYKPTGDGLLIVIPYTAESLKEIANNAIVNCLNLMLNFNKLREGDDMIYFPTPEKIGIGVSRGLACRISSNGIILDYSGRVINLASRLNDLARPCGVVFDSGLGITLFPKEIQEFFLSENVYIRGITENKLISVYYTKHYTIIPPSRKELPKEPKWLSKSTSETYGNLNRDLAAGIGLYDILLEEKPYDAKQIYIEVGFTAEDGSRVFFEANVQSKGIDYRQRGTKNYVGFSYKALLQKLEELKADIKEDTVITFDVTYPVIEKNVEAKEKEEKR